MSSRDGSEESSPSLRKTLMGVAAPTREQIREQSEPAILLERKKASPEIPAPSSPLDTEPMSRPPTSQLLNARPKGMAAQQASVVEPVEPQRPQSEPAPVPNPASRLATAPNPRVGVDKPLTARMPSQPVMHPGQTGAAIMHPGHQNKPQVRPDAQPMRAPMRAPNRPDTAGGLGDGPIRVVCRRCQRSVWGWKLPFGVSCPTGPHHAHISWLMVGVVATFWTIFFVLSISLISIVAG